MNTSLRYKCIPFQELNLDELYAIMALRQIVFIVEQECPYLDADGKDQYAHHLMGFDGSDKLVAYTRLLPEGISYEEYCSIGRVVSHPDVRGQKLGKEIMRESIKYCNTFYPNSPIKISAQCYLTKFYSSFGFESTGSSYLEDDIPHIAMIKK